MRCRICYINIASFVLNFFFALAYLSSIFASKVFITKDKPNNNYANLNAFLALIDVPQFGLHFPGITIDNAASILLIKLFILSHGQLVCYFFFNIFIIPIIKLFNSTKKLFNCTIIVILFYTFLILNTQKNVIFRYIIHNYKLKLKLNNVYHPIQDQDIYLII